MLDGIKAIDRVLRTSEVASLATLAQAIESSTRTVQRYLAYMKDAMDAPIAFDTVRGGYCYTRPTFDLPGTFLTDEEMRTLFVGLPLLSPIKGTRMERLFRRVFDKLARRLPEKTRKEFESYPRAMCYGNGVAPCNAEFFDILLEAAIRNLTVEIATRNNSSPETVSDLFDPYVLCHADGCWILVGYCHSRRRIHVHDCHHVLQVIPSENSFARPDRFDPEDYIKDWKGSEPRHGPHAR